MKRNILFAISLALVAVLVASCEGEAVMSPNVQYSSIIYRSYTTESSQGQDSIVRDTVSLTDSLNVGDTVCFPMILHGYYDYIVSFVATSDTSKVAVSFLWDEELEEFLDTTADPEHGNLTFVPNKVYSCLTSLIYVPKAPGTHRVDLVLTSAAKDPYSQWAAHFFVGVKNQ